MISIGIPPSKLFIEHYLTHFFNKCHPINLLNHNEITNNSINIDLNVLSEVFSLKN